MLVHAVFVWLKDDLSTADRQKFLDGMQSLKSIAGTEGCYVGVPSSTNRPVIDRSYDYGLTILFKDMAAHDRYQVDPIHATFLRECSPLWKKIVIYDPEE
jgi:hypothetical protein